MKIFRFFPSLIIVCIINFLFIQSVEAQSRADRILTKKAERITNDEFRHFSQTPNGARIYSVNQPSNKMLDAIDDGLAALFAAARRNNYGKRLNYYDYTIFIAKPDRTKDGNQQYSPDIAIGAAQYAGTVYDKGGYIYAAGMVLSFNPGAFIIADHNKNFQRVSDVVSYEGEHLVLYHNDRELFAKTADHSKGGGHPILQ